jgi:hypothetical protein
METRTIMGPCHECIYMLSDSRIKHRMETCTRTRERNLGVARSPRLWLCDYRQISQKHSQASCCDKNHHLLPTIDTLLSRLSFLQHKQRLTMTNKHTNCPTDSESPKAASSRPFYDAVVADHCADGRSNKKMRIGENGMPEYTDQGIGSDILALNQLVRGGTVDTLVQQVLTRSQTPEVVDLLVLLFSTRNARGGKGEKKLAYDMFLQVWKQYPVTSGELLPLFAHYGYWKDLLLLLVQVKDDVEASASSKTSFKTLVSRHTRPKTRMPTPPMTQPRRCAAVDRALVCCPSGSRAKGLRWTSKLTLLVHSLPCCGHRRILPRNIMASSSRRRRLRRGSRPPRSAIVKKLPK